VQWVLQRDSKERITDLNAMITLAAEDCVKVGDFLYFIAKNYNFIFKLGLTSGDISIIDSIPEERVLSKRLGAKIINCGTYLFFAPMNAHKIWRYDLENNEWKGYAIKESAEFGETDKFFQAVKYKEKIFFLGSNYPSIVVFDLNTDNIEYIKEPYLDRAAIAKEKKDSFFRTDYAQVDNKLYRASCLTNEVLQFDLDNYDFQYIKIGAKGFRYSGIDFDGQYFYLAPRVNTPAVMWDGKEKIEEVPLPYTGDKNSYIWGGVTCKEDEVEYYACFDNNSVIVDKRGNTTVKKVKYFFNKRICIDGYVSLDSEGNLQVDIDGKKYQHDLKVEKGYVLDYIGKEMKRRGELDALLNGERVYKENRTINLELLLKVLA